MEYDYKMACDELGEQTVTVRYEIHVPCDDNGRDCVEDAEVEFSTAMLDIGDVSVDIFDIIPQSTRDSISDAILEFHNNHCDGE